MCLRSRGMQISFHNELRQFSGFFARAMTSRDCFYCGKRVAAGKSCSVLFLDGRGYPPSDSEIIQYAQLCAIQPANMMQAM
jgi:hypothetical protein